MSLFPDITYGYPLEIEDLWNTIISDMVSGKENRTQTWPFNKQIIGVPVPSISYADLKSVRDFFNNTCKGARYSFRFKDAVSKSYTKEFVDQGDAATVTFNTPCIDGSAGTTTAYVDNVETSVTFGDGTGSDGLDQVTFNPAPADGAIITVSFTGKWTPLVRFPDKLSWSQLRHLIYAYKQIPLYVVRT